MKCTLAEMEKNGEKLFEFAPRSARYVKLLALSAVDGGKQATVAELEILVVD